eukprot:gene8933-882_t
MRKIYKLYQTDDELKNNKEELKEMCEELSKYGYFYTEIPEDLGLAVEEVVPVSKSFFQLSMEEKINFANPGSKHKFIKGDKLVLPDKREFYDVQQQNFINMKDENFIKPTRKAFKLYENYSELYMKQIIFGIEGDLDYVKSLYGKSISTLRLLHYFETKNEIISCLPHSDMGFITLAICFSSGLEIKELSTNKYFDAEKNAPSEHCMMIFAGESLARLSGGYFKSPIHRVKSMKERYSLPFFFRGRNNAELDVMKLNSDYLSKKIDLDDKYLMAPMKIAKLYDLTKQQYIEGEHPIELGKYKKEEYWNLEE